MIYVGTCFKDLDLLIGIRFSSSQMINFGIFSLEFYRDELEIFLHFRLDIMELLLHIFIFIPSKNLTIFLLKSYRNLSNKFAVYYPIFPCSFGKKSALFLQSERFLIVLMLKLQNHSLEVVTHLLGYSNTF